MGAAGVRRAMSKQDKARSGIPALMLVVADDDDGGSFDVVDWENCDGSEGGRGSAIYEKDLESA